MMAQEHKEFVLDRHLCKGCGICTALCPKSVLDTDEAGNPVFARPDDCISCMLCELRCPDFAIRMLGGN